MFMDKSVVVDYPRYPLKGRVLTLVVIIAQVGKTCERQILVIILPLSFITLTIFVKTIKLLFLIDALAN
jgi:hypothetical protein